MRLIVLLLGALHRGAWLIAVILLPSTSTQAQTVEKWEQLNDKVTALFDAGQYAEATPLAEQALAWAEQLPGPDHARTAVSLTNLAVLYREQGDYARAEPLYKRALEIREKWFGSEHPLTATSLSNLALLYQDQGEYKQAEPLYVRSLAIREKVLGPDDPATAASLNTLAMLYQAEGEYASAEPLYRRALAIRLEVTPADPETATSFSNLGGLLRAQGDYAGAEPLLVRAVAIRAQAMESNHPETAVALHNLAGLYVEQGAYARAEPLLLRALAIIEKALGSEHPYTATSLNNLAALYRKQGAFDRAEPLLIRALAITEKALGPEHPGTASSLNNLAALYRTQRQYARALPLYARALTIMQKALPPEHPNIATSLNNLAGLYKAQGDYTRAEPLYLGALTIRDKAFGPDHPDSAAARNNLGSLYSAQNDYARAVPLYRQALALNEKLLGSEHPRTADSLNNLGQLEAGQEHYAEALPLLRRATLIRERRADLAAASLSAGGDQELRTAREQLTGHVKVAFDATTHGMAAPPLHDEAFAAGQLAHATVAGDAVGRMAARFAAGDNDLARLVKQREDLVLRWRELDASLVQAVSRPAVQREPAVEAERRVALAAAQQEVEALDQQIKDRFPDYAALTAPTPLEATVAQALLRPGEALVAFLVDEDRSFAWVVRPGQALVMLPLAIGRDELTADIELLRIGFAGRGGRGVPARLAPEATELQTRGLDFHDGRSVVEMFDVDLAHRLYEQIWAPLEPHLAGVEHVLVVPDGALESLPLSVLVSEPPAEPGSELSQSEQLREVAWLAKRPYAISVLPAVRSLGALRDPKLAPNIMPGTRFIGFGDPQIGDLEATATCPEPGAPLVEMAALDRGADDAGKAEPAALYGGGFAGEVPVADVDAVRALPRLADSRCELQALAGSLGAGEDALHIGPAATEAAVKQLSEAGTLRRAGVLAFATHGLVAGELKGLAEPALVLTPPANGTAEDDGLLTASEVAQLDLNANWVLLSACNTASPDGSPGAEGLSGLARAFFYAGTRALLVSHWSVASPAAVALTTGTLARLQQQPRLGRAEALHRTMQDLIATGPNPNPAFWAPFTLVGEGLL